MTANRITIADWFLQGLKGRATHLIVVCDQFDFDDYPVYVLPGENVRDKVAEYDEKNMQKVMEVYNLKLDMTAQLDEYRAMNF